jgi:putative tryptophan/tyrosine transport system substrate-binding protein
LVQRKVDVIVTHSAAPVIAAKQATAAIPIVFATAADPLGNGLVANLARPGGNVTGLSAQVNDAAAKRLELLRELIPALRRLAIMVNADAPAAMLEVADDEATARALGLEVVISKIRRAEDIAPALEALKGRADALIVTPEPLVLTNRVGINILAAAAHVPTIYGLGNTLKREGSWPTAQMCRTNSGALPTSSTRFARDEAGRHPGRAADQVRSRHQPYDRQGARPHDSTHAPCPRRRGD